MSGRPKVRVVYPDGSEATQDIVEAINDIQAAIQEELGDGRWGSIYRQDGEEIALRAVVLLRLGG